MFLPPLISPQNLTTINDLKDNLAQHYKFTKEERGTLSENVAEEVGNLAQFSQRAWETRN